MSRPAVTSKLAFVPTRDDMRRELADSAPTALVDDVRSGLIERHRARLRASEGIEIAARTGVDNAWLMVAVGAPARPHVIELYVENVTGDLLEGALGVLVDFLDGALGELLDDDRDARFPLDFAPRRFGGATVLARSEIRDLDAEAQARALLGSDDDA